MELKLQSKLVILGEQNSLMMPVQRKIQPQIISNGKTMPLEDFMAKLQEGADFEKTTDVWIDEFHKRLLEKGLSEREADRYKDDCTSFIGICGIKYSIKSLNDITRAMLSTHLSAMQRAIGGNGNTKEEEYILKSFFIFLHKEKNITNKKVLGGLCSKLELKEMGIK